jgi:cell division septation protein DedD
MGGPEAAAPPQPSGMPPLEPPTPSGMPPLEPPPPPTPPIPDAAPDPLAGLLSDGPISEQKTFDEPVFEQEQVVEDAGGKRSRKSPSPFVVVGGALIIIIGLLYGALTYLKRDKPQMLTVSSPPVSVAVVPPKPEPVPVPEPGTAVVEVQIENQLPGETVQPAEIEVAPSEPTEDPIQETAPVVIVPTTKPAPEPAPVVATGSVQYSIQVGAFILDSSVAELEKKLRTLGYDPFLKKGSTTAMMNMLTVGPFGKVSDAKAALSRLQGSGVDSNMRRRNDGGAIINAGSYLLEENATSIMKKIRSLGYPVKLSKKEARLPMTFVRVGRYSGMDDATSAKVEMKGQGLDGIVVKLQ